MCFHPSSFGLPRPFRSRVRSRHATDRRMDRRTDIHFIMPLPTENAYQTCWNILLCAVCITVGCLMSYLNRPVFPEMCGSYILDDAAIFDTMVRISGSWADIPHAFKAVADKYGWRHFVLLSDDVITLKVCSLGAEPFEKVFGYDGNYTFTWFRLSAEPTDEHLDDILDHVRSHSRGIYCASSITI